METKKKKKSGWFSNSLILLIFLVGAGIFLYPTVSDTWNRYRNQKLITSYSDTIEHLSEEDYSLAWEEAREYNQQHTVNVIRAVLEEETETSENETESDAALKTEEENRYDRLLNPAGNGIMGYVKIPVIDVELAIYHGVGSEALEKGCGHIEGTSLPIGGEGTHAVLSAHRGLPSAELFTDLDQVKEGDLFYITVLDETLAYEVDQILTVLPDEVEALAIEENEDYVTLVTCTPYAVNTHRLLVRGKRTEYVEPELEKDNPIKQVVVTENLTRRLLIIGGGVFFALVLLMAIIFRKKKRKE